MKKFIILLIVCLTLTACNAATETSNQSAQLSTQWIDNELAGKIPSLDEFEGEILYDYEDELEVGVFVQDKKIIKEYVNMCIEMGYDVDSSKDNYGYSAFNDEGYYLDISYYYDDGMTVKIEAPMQFEKITWPSFGLATLVPEPPVSEGSFENDSENYLFVFLKGMDKEAYRKYVDDCSKKGFVIDYSKGDSYYYADDEIGNSIRVEYEGWNTVSLRINKTDREEVETKPFVNVEDTKDVEVETNVENTEIRSEFKEAVDAYESFFDEYVAFMTEYANSGYNASMTTDYLNYLNKYTEAIEKMGALNNGDLSSAELAYYLEAYGRISQKILAIS